MSDDPRFFANRDPSLRSDPAHATEVNQMYTQTQLPGHIRGGYQLGTSGVLGAPYGQNTEHPSLRQISAPAQGFFAPTNPSSAYPSSTHSTQASSMLPAAGGHQRHAPVGALNHTGNFGANFNVSASNLHHGHTVGHSTSTPFNGRGGIPTLAPLQTSSHAVMIPSQTPTPPMTAGTSRPSSYTPETPGNANVSVPPTVEEFKTVFYKAMLPQLPDADLDYVRLRHDEGDPMPPVGICLLIVANKANGVSPTEHHAPPMQSIPAYSATNGAPHSHANGTPGAQRRAKTRQPRHDPLRATTTTYQAAATGADLTNNNHTSTGATLRGGARSSGAGRVASSRTRSTMKPTGTPASEGGIALPENSPRKGKGSWATTLLHTAGEHTILDIMCTQPSTTCLWPECDQGECSSVQRRNSHVFRIHTGTEKKELCEWPGCDSVLADDSRRRHRKAHVLKAAAEQARAAAEMAAAEAAARME